MAAWNQGLPLEKLPHTRRRVAGDRGPVHQPAQGPSVSNIEQHLHCAAEPLRLQKRAQQPHEVAGIMGMLDSCQKADLGQRAQADGCVSCPRRESTQVVFGFESSQNQFDKPRRCAAGNCRTSTDPGRAWRQGSQAPTHRVGHRSLARRNQRKVIGLRRKGPDSVRARRAPTTLRATPSAGARSSSSTRITRRPLAPRRSTSAAATTGATSRKRAAMPARTTAARCRTARPTSATPTRTATLERSATLVTSALKDRITSNPRRLPHAAASARATTIAAASTSASVLRD